MMASQVHGKEARPQTLGGLPGLTDVWARAVQLVWITLLLLILFILFFRVQETMVPAHVSLWFKSPEARGGSGA